jgi:thiol-disulfide isomerase/thioredoxin
MAKSKNSSFYLYGAAVLVVVGIIAFAASNSASNSAPSVYDEFAQCVTDAGAVEYGAWWCPHCADQKELFGSSFEYVNYVECSTAARTMNDTCRDAGIEGYPTWEFADGSRVGGAQTLEFLAEKTGCELPEVES